MSGTNTYSGNTLVSSGTLVVGSPLALQNSTLDTSGTGVLSFGSLTCGTLGGLTGPGALAMANAASAAFALGVGMNNVGTTYTGTLSGAGGMTKVGTGNLCLTAANTYQGSTIVNGGTLTIGAGGTSGSLSPGSLLSIGSGATLAFNLSNTATQGIGFSSNPISGAGGITQLGPGLLVLNAANTFSGTTSIAGGTLLLSNSLALQNSPLAVSGGTIAFDPAVSSHAFALGGLIGTCNIALSDGTNPLNLAVGNNVSSTTYAGVLSGNGSLQKVGSNTITLTGANTFQGGTTVSGGTLALGNPNALSSNGSITFAGGTLRYAVSGVKDYSSAIANSSGAIKIDPNGFLVTFGGAIGASNTAGLTKLGSGTLALAGANTYSGTTTLAAGWLILSNSLALQNSTLSLSAGALAFNPAVTSHSFTVGGLAGTVAVALTDGTNPICLSVGNNSVGTQYSGILSGSGALMKVGTGSLIMTAANTYTGATIINGGTVTLTNARALQNSTLDTSGGGILQFGSLTSGTLGGLTGSGALVLTNSSAAALALSVGNNNSNTTFSGWLNGSGSLTKIGSGSITLTNSNTYTGGTAIYGGVLAAGAVNALSASSAITVSSGTLNVSGFANTVASLNIGSSGSLNLGLGNTLASSGTAGLGGKLSVAGTGTLGNYALITYNNRSGTFASVTGLDPNYGLVYNSNGTELDALHKAQIGTVTAVNFTVITGGITSLTVANAAPALGDGLSFTASATGTGFTLNASGSAAAASSAATAGSFNTRIADTRLLYGRRCRNRHKQHLGRRGNRQRRHARHCRQRARSCQRLAVADRQSELADHRLRQRTQGRRRAGAILHHLQPGGKHVGRLYGQSEAHWIFGGGDPDLSTNLATFNALTAGNGNTFSASLNTSNVTTTGSYVITLAGLQLLDDSNSPGAGSNNNGGLTITLLGTVGGATAASGSGSFGTPATAPVAGGGSYAGLASTVTATSGSGGSAMGTTATILAGSNTSGAAQTVGMAWRAATAAEQLGDGVISDVLQLGGMAISPSSARRQPSSCRSLTTPPY